MHIFRCDYFKFAVWIGIRDLVNNRRCPIVDGTAQDIKKLNIPGIESKQKKRRSFL